jgi:hypothetical protein
MPRNKKVKIQLEDDDGSKYSLIFEGNIDKSKILRAVELLQLINNDEDEKDEEISLSSTGDKIWHLIEEYYPLTQFTSTNLLEAYEDTYNEPIKLSVISTYLSRFTRRGLLSRVKGKNEWIYKKVIKQPQFR